MPKIMTKILSRLFLLLISFHAVHAMAETTKIAIIIDDIGYRVTDKNVLNIPGNITYAILPHTPYGKILALQANAKKHDVLLHIPMEAENGKRLGPGALTTSMSEGNIHESLAASFAEIPFAIGINNHMGSRLTKLYEPMSWTMNFLKNRQLLFLDSKTCLESQAHQAALDAGVPVHQRHIFLDNNLDDAYIENQFNQLINTAKKNKSAIAIAHPHPETVKNLTRLIPLLAKHNIELVPLSELYTTPVTLTANVAANEPNKKL
jgi:polysaccharide deacetylase 2 family uncharacterized protein YibQ